MATLNNPLLSQISGKLGNLVIYQLNGKTVIRKRPERTVPYEASKLQKFNQLAFREVQQFLLPLKEVLDFGFGEFSTGLRKGIHLAMSWAMKHAVTGEDDKVLLHKTNIRVSQGDLPLPVEISLTRAGGDQLRIVWDSAGSRGSARVTDHTWVVLYHPGEKKVMEIREGSHRAAESQLVPVAGIFKDSGVLVYLSFYRKKSGNKFRFSASICLELN